MLKFFILAVLVVLGALTTLAAAVGGPGWWVLVAVVALLLALAVYDVTQKRHSILRNYPVLGHMRFLLEDIRPELQQYFIERNWDGRPFDRDTRSSIYQRAKDLKTEQPFGTERDVDEPGYEYLVHSTAPVAKAETPPRVRIGGPHCTAPYDMALMNVSAMSFGALSGNALTALNAGAARGGFAHDTGEGGLSKYHRQGGDLVWEIGSGYFGARTKDGDFDPAKFADTAALDQVKLVSLKLSQGAKPGIGGVLPGAKVTQEIAEARGVPQGEKCVSPPAHKVFSTPRELVLFIARMRELSGGKPAGFKLCLGSRADFLGICKAMVAEGVAPDFIIVDGGEGGTGAAPLEYEDHIGTPLTEGLLTVDNALRGVGLRDQVKVGASAKVATGIDIVKRLVQGADYTNSARSMMMAVGCIQAQLCHTNTCPVGVATQDPKRARALDVPDKTDRVFHYQQACVEQAMQVMASMGVRGPDELRPHMLRRRISHDAVRSYAEMFHHLSDGELLATPPQGHWERDWNLADPDRFTPESRRASVATVAELLIESLAEYGVTSVWGVVGDALNPVTDAIRREDRIDWIGVRHEEAGAFAASAQAQLTGRLAVCMGTVGPGAVHLLNGLYDAKKSHAPVLAIVGQVPREEIGSDFFQEVDNDKVFADVAVFNRTVTSIDQLPRMIEQAGNTAIQQSGVAVLTLPGDVGGLDLPHGTVAPRFVDSHPSSSPDLDELRRAAALLNAAGSVTLLVGHGALHARAEVLELAARLAAPMVLTLKAKEVMEQDNEFEIGQSGLIGNHATAEAFDGCDALFLVGTDFPYPEFLPSGKQVVQLDLRGHHVGRRTPVDVGLVGDSRLGVAALLPLLEQKTDRGHLDSARTSYAAWQKRQRQFLDPEYDRKPKGLLRRKVDNPESRIRPELLADAIDRHAASDAVFTSDTGMATVWLSRFVRMSGTRRLIGSYNLGSMANAMPMALGASALDRSRQVVAFCGDGGLSMLLGDLITAVSHDLPVKLVVFDNGRLGMVKLEMEQVGLPEFGTVLHNPDFARVAEAIGLHGVRVERPGDVDDAVREALAHEGPVLLDVLTNPDEIAVPPSPTLSQGWGFAIAKSKEFVDSPE